MIDRYALAVWNHRNRRAREDYHAHPLATHLPNRYFAGCDHCARARGTK